MSCSGVHASRLTDLIFDMCAPRPRCTPAHRTHRNTPMFHDAHRGPLECRSAYEQRERTVKRKGSAYLVRGSRRSRRWRDPSAAPPGLAPLCPSCCWRPAGWLACFVYVIKRCDWSKKEQRMNRGKACGDTTGRKGPVKRPKIKEYASARAKNERPHCAWNLTLDQPHLCPFRSALFYM